MPSRAAAVAAHDEHHHHHAEPIFVPLLKLAAIAVSAILAVATWSQCSSVYHGHDASVGPKLCLAEQLDSSFPHDHWLHETTLLSAARLRQMMLIDPAFDVAVLARPTEVDAFAALLERECGFTLEQAGSAKDWTWSLAAKGKVFKLSRFAADGDRLVHREAAAPSEVVERRSILPTKPCAVGDAQFQCPKEEHVLLAKIFGTNWREAPLLSFLK